jgi:hypothetical protein
MPIRDDHSAKNKKHPRNRKKVSARSAWAFAQRMFRVPLVRPKKEQRLPMAAQS